MNVTNWKKISVTEVIEVRDTVDNLLTEGYRVSDWIIDIADNIKPSINEKVYDLWRISLSDMGFIGPTKIKDFYKKFQENGFSTIPPELALLTRREYKDQPISEWLRIATPLGSMIDSDGVPHLPKLGSALGNYYVETYWAWPDAIFHPHNEFVVEKL